MSSLRLLSWKTRLAGLVLCPLVLIGPGLLGPEPRTNDSTDVAATMSPGWMLFAWLCAAPFVAAEVAASLTGRRWMSRASAVVAVLLLTAVASLPVVISFGGAQEPTNGAWSLMAINTYGVLVVGYLLGSIVACFLASAWTPRPEEAVDAR